MPSAARRLARFVVGLGLPDVPARVVQRAFGAMAAAGKLYGLTED